LTIHNEVHVSLLLPPIEESPKAEESLQRYPQLGKRIDKMVPKVLLEPEFWRA
jgi:hypothetical protein